MILSDPARPAGQDSCSISIASTNESDPWNGSSAVKADEGKTRDWVNMAVWGARKEISSVWICPSVANGDETDLVP
jgi:hypothetical protein